MELEKDLSCGRCKHREKLQEKSETSGRIRHIKTFIQCSHKNNHGAYKTIDRRIEHYGSGKDSCHERERTRFKSNCPDRYKCCDNRFSGKRHSNRCQSSTSDRSGSTESGCRSDDSFCMNSNSFLPCPCPSQNEMKKRSCKRNLECSSCSCIHMSSPMIHEHKYFHCCQRVKRPCHGLHFHHKKGRQLEHYLSASNVGVVKVRTRNEFPCCKHRYCCDFKGSGSTPDFLHLNPHEDTSCRLCTIGVQKEVVSTMKGINSGCFPSPEHSVHDLNIPIVKHVNLPFGYESSSQNINAWQNGLTRSCTVAKSKIITQETDKQYHKDEWLQLCLKTPQGKKHTVEGFSKHDLKLSLPDVKEWFNRRNIFHSHENHNEEVKRVDHNAYSTHPSCICYPYRCRGTDPSLCHQRRESLNHCEVEPTLTCVPDLNLPSNMMNTCSDINMPENLRLDLYCNCSTNHRKEQPCSAVLNQMSTQGHSDYEENRCCRPAVLPDLRMANSVSQAMISHNELFKDIPVGDSTVNALEDKCFKKNTIWTLPGQHNDVAMCEKGSATEDILANHETPILSGGSNLEGKLRSGNAVGIRTKDKVDIDLNLMQTHSVQSPENSPQHGGLDACFPADNCSIVEISSSEDEYVVNCKENNKLPSMNSLMEESGEVIPQGNLEVKGLENDTAAEENFVRGVDNYETVPNFGEGGSMETFRSQENNMLHKSLSTENHGDIPTVSSRKGNLGVLEHNLVDPQLDSYESNLSEPHCSEELLQIANRKIRKWDKDIICDLCGQGPSLMYGEWYAWCCGSRLYYCKCTDDHKQKLLTSMKSKNGKSSKKWKGHQWSGKVHRMCGLWSAEVFEKDDARDQLEGLLVSVRRARLLVCAECRRFGASLGCREGKCKRSFHYPCANWLSSKLWCQMWEGFKYPVACYNHINIDDFCLSAKDRKIHVDMKYISNLSNTVKGKQNVQTFLEKTIPEDVSSLKKIKVKEELDINNQDVTEAIAGDVDDLAKSTHLSRCYKNRTRVDATVSNERLSDLKCDVTRSADDRTTRYRKGHDVIKYLGQNLICKDISNETEVIQIPCTNDVDYDPVPKFLYIPKNRFSTQATSIVESVLSNMAKQAKACDGCDEFDMDDPESSVSIHIHRNLCSRDQDDRIDWQGEPMLGRLAYDCYGRLQLGIATPDAVECNSRCPCGLKCLNRELQHGLSAGLEVFKTQDQGWSVRALEQIPRGKFVVEYVGEVLSQDEAANRQKMDAKYNLRYLFSMDHPTVPPEDQLVVDIFGMSNVARFINHSCAGNLSIHRVYTETLDHRLFRLGMYACRDIERGEELTYDYKIPTKEPVA